MTTLDQIRNGLGRAWDSLAEGWSHLRERASDAVTRFYPGRDGGELQTVEDQVALGGPRWGLLAAEVQEDDKQVTVRLEVPGMDREDFELSVVEGRILVVNGEKRVQKEDHRGRYHVMECAYGRFERAVPLPAEVDGDGAKAKYRKGVLQVSLPKTGGGSRRIEVRTD